MQVRSELSQLQPEPGGSAVSGGLSDLGSLGELSTEAGARGREMSLRRNGGRICIRLIRAYPWVSVNSGGALDRRTDRCWQRVAGLPVTP